MFRCLRVLRSGQKLCLQPSKTIYSVISPGLKYGRHFEIKRLCVLRESNITTKVLYRSSFLKDKSLWVSKPHLLAFRSIKTSKPRNVPPILWVVVNPILKLTAILTGRSFRKWWKDLPPNKRKYFIERIKANKRGIGVFLGLGILLSGGYYVSHLEETPITKRKRFIAFNSKQMEKINQFEVQQILQNLGPHILPADHPYTRRVAALVHRIVVANSDIKEIREKKFGVAVIDNSIENAFVLPVGYVFVFTGMMKLCSNDDQLGIILSHEIAHCIQNHGVENVSFAQLLDFISIAIITLIWAAFPSDSISLLTHWLYQKMMQLLLELPYSRKIEREADEVGLQLAAKACFDVRESSAFWSKMAFFNRTMRDSPEIEFLSTHPSHESRSEHLDSLMDKAVKLRSACNCPRLPYRDPRQDVEAVSRVLEMTRRQFYENNVKPVIIIK